LRNTVIPTRVLIVPIAIVIDLGVIVVIQSRGEKKFTFGTLIIPAIVGLIGNRMARALSEHADSI
jgi:hypothetical protein